MEVAIRANRVSAGRIRQRFVALTGRLVHRRRGFARAASNAGQAQDEAAARRCREQATFGVIGLGGRGLFS